MTPINEELDKIIVAELRARHTPLEASQPDPCDIEVHFIHEEDAAEEAHRRWLEQRASWNSKG